MASPSSLEREAIQQKSRKQQQQQPDLYGQLREQLLLEVQRYRNEGKNKLADIISQSLHEY
jgi:hypothetical protein